MDFLDLLLTGAELATEAGKRKMARFCYEVTRKRWTYIKQQKTPPWEELQETEQAVWMSCVWQQLREDN